MARLKANDDDRYRTESAAIVAAETLAGRLLTGEEAAEVRAAFARALRESEEPEELEPVDDASDEDGLVSTAFTVTLRAEVSGAEALVLKEILREAMTRVTESVLRALRHQTATAAAPTLTGVLSVEDTA